LTRASDPSPEAILRQALALRSQIAELLDRAARAAPAPAEPPPTREALLRRVVSLYMEAERVRVEAEGFAEAEAQAKLLVEATSLLRAFEIARDRYDRAIAIAARQLLLRQVLDLRSEAVNALARVRLIPDVITG
jgi:hypothetical protein